MEKKKILIVDDEKEISDLLELYLIDAGFDIYKFYSAEGVMECIEKEGIDLAILDVMLPDTDGFFLCRNILKKRRKIYEAL